MKKKNFIPCRFHGKAEIYPDFCSLCKPKKEYLILNTEEKNNVETISELLLQCMELFPEAKNHVEQYLNYDQLHEFREKIKNMKGE